MIGGDVLQFVDEIRYLGVYLLSGMHFKCTFCHSKLKFYRCFNALYSKSQSSSSELIAVQLLKSYCLPLFLYACEAISVTTSDCKMFDKLINSALFKIFKTFDMNVITDIRYYVDLPPVQVIINKRMTKFVNKFSTKNMSFCRTILLMNAWHDGDLYTYISDA